MAHLLTIEMATRYPIPDVWLATPEGVQKHDWKQHGRLDLNQADDENSEPAVFPPEVVEVLGFNPMEEIGTKEV